MYLASVDIDMLIKEDCPYFDLTGFTLGIDSQPADISCFTREDCVVCGTEEAAAVFKKLDIEVKKLIPSGQEARAGDVLISGRGPASAAVTAWKVIQNLIDHTSGIATKTKRLVDAVHAADPEKSVLTTRKMYPGTKALAIKAIMAGGAFPHRLGISETVLVFAQHMNLIGGKEAFIKKLPDMKRACCEKKILVETSVLEDALRYLKAGADGIQLEKLKPAEINEIVKSIRKEFPNAVILAAGGINEKNAGEYAACDVQGLVTTSLYTAQPTDVGVRIKLADGE